MICFVDIEHESWLQVYEERLSHNDYMMQVKNRLARLSGQPCLVLRYPEVTLELMRELNIQAIVISGNATIQDQYEEGCFDELNRIIRDGEWPMMGLCGGHQVIAAAFGGSSAPMRALAPDEEDITDLSGPGYLKEWGFTAVDIVKDDPIFEGLGDAPIFHEVHFWEIKDLPPEFDILASTDTCRIQVIKHRDRLIYGTQFHPEAYHDGSLDLPNNLVKLVYPDGYGEERLDGKFLIRNFFKATGVL